MPQTSALYLIGYLVVVAGLAYAAHLAHAPSPWIIAGVIVLLGIGILKTVTSTTRRVPPSQ